MRKVKKGTGLTVSRAARATPSRTGRTGRATTGKVAGTPRSPGKAASPRKGAKRKKETPARSVRIRELDPVARCGPGTSVQRLYRVDELLDGAPTAHLVFFDRHGWYCEHGRHCPAVADVRKHG